MSGARCWSATTAIIWGDPMLRTKTADRIACIAAAVMLAVSVCVWGTVENVQGDGRHTVGYEALLFDQSRVHTIDIVMSDWDDLISHATDEEYRQCSITIDGENIGAAAIRAKGNTSLSSVAGLGSSRYSFKVEFDQYVKGKTYHGLDKLSLNNLIQDATMMKDYLAYTLMNRMGVPSSLCSYAQITVNGEPWGLYLAVEGVEDGFMERNGMTKGELYKPDSMSFGGGRGNGREFDIENFRVQEDKNTENTPGDEKPSAQAGRQEEGSFGGSSGEQQDGFMASGGENARPAADGTGETTEGAPANRQQDFAASNSESMDQDSNGVFNGNRAEDEGFGDSGGDRAGNGGFGGGGFNFGMGSEDVKLVYTDDDPDSYSNIFNNAKTKITLKDKNRLIASLKKLKEKEDLDRIVNKDEVTTYLAVHHFLCNDDSYTGMMVHNYYLYEENGRLSIIPWDYNLGFGGFSAGTNATSTVNSPIDNPVSNGTADSRPLIGWIFSDEEALNNYHETYSRFISECVENGWLDGEITRIQELINPYLEQDSSKFYSMEDYEKAVSTLRTFCAKRGESVRGQLDGTIPSTSNGQRNSSALIDAGDISTADMGSMNGMGGGFGRGEGSGAQTEGGSDSGNGEFAGSGGGRADSGESGSFGGSAGGTAATGEKTPEPAETPAETPETGTMAPEKETGAETAPEIQSETAPVTGAPEDTQTTVQPENAAAAESGPRSDEGGSRGSSGESSEWQENGERPSGGFGGFSGEGGYMGREYQLAIWIWTGACAAALLAAVLIFRKAGSHND